jgi:hypothetical protein
MSNKTLAEQEIGSDPAFRQTPPRRPTTMPVQEIAIWTPSYLLKCALAGCLRFFAPGAVETSRAE